MKSNRRRARSQQRLISVWVIVQFFIITVYLKPILWDKGWGETRIDVVMVAFGLIILFSGSGPLGLGRRIFRGARWAD